MVEMAMVLPLFIILIYGIIEFSFAFAQNNELRAMAREGARLAAVESISSQAITDQLCPRIRLLDPATFGFKADGADSNGTSPAGSKGSIGEVYAEASVRTLTGFFDGALDGILLTSTVRFHVERPTDAAPVWWGPTGSPMSCS
jgi:Flp pilus assembly protein TadG